MLVKTFFFDYLNYLIAGKILLRFDGPTEYWFAYPNWAVGGAALPSWLQIFSLPS